MFACKTVYGKWLKYRKANIYKRNTQIAQAANLKAFL